MNETNVETLARAVQEGRWCRWGCGLAGCRNCHPQPVRFAGVTHDGTHSGCWVCDEMVNGNPS